MFATPIHEKENRLHVTLFKALTSVPVPNRPERKRAWKLKPLWEG